MITWKDVPVSAEHAALLADSAITADVAAAAGVRTVTTRDGLPEELRGHPKVTLPALLFPLTGVSGTIVHQVRRDDGDRTDNDPKYVFPSGARPVLVQHPHMAARVADTSAPLLIVEGTKQYLAAVSALAGARQAAVGISGCWGWSSQGRPVPDLACIPWEGREVYLVLDADVAENRQVWMAAERLADTVRLRGAAKVRFVKVPGGGKSGLDDVLGTLDDPAKGLQRLLADAKDKLPRRPAARKKRPEWMDPDDGSLLVDRFATILREKRPMALARDETVAVYTRGVYRVGPLALADVVAAEMGDLFRPAHRAAVEEYIAASLWGEGRVLPEMADEPVVNLANGMLDLRTGELRPHDPAYLSSVQLPVAWDPDATCPTYEAWAAAQIGDQLDDLEEVASTMLDPSRCPPKAIFLYGPSRSGKSTFLRLLKQVAGEANTSAVTLQQLSDDRFASANVYAKVLNCAADLPAAHVNDLSVFKMLTGEDPITANRKYGKQFVFTNRALFAFSANEIPTVGETSGAYFERVKPFAFKRSFAGREDPHLEVTLREELPGILVRWVRAWQRLNARGRYLPTAEKVAEEFAAGSNRVHRWVTECCQIVTSIPPGGKSESATAVTYGATLPPEYGTTKSDLYKAFSDWSLETGGSKMSRTKFLSHLTSINGVTEIRLKPAKQRALNVVIRDDMDEPWDDDDGASGKSGSSEAPSSMRADGGNDHERERNQHGEGCAETATPATNGMAAPPPPAVTDGDTPPPRQAPRVTLPPEFKIYRRPTDPIFRPSHTVINTETHP